MNQSSSCGESLQPFSTLLARYLRDSTLWPFQSGGWLRHSFGKNRRGCDSSSLVQTTLRGRSRCRRLLDHAGSRSRHHYRRGESDGSQRGHRILPSCEHNSISLISHHSSVKSLTGSEREPLLRPLWLVFFTLALLWATAMIGGYTGWTVHSLLLLAVTTGLLILERKTGLLSIARRLFRKVLESRSLVSLGRMTRDVFVNLQRVPIHVVLSVAYLLGSFGAAIVLLLTMIN